jgi:nucleoside-diphosphate-sugar epimerase
MAVRMIADALMVNAALLIALAARFVWRIWFEISTISPQVALRNYTLDFLHSFWLLTILSMIIFFASGFYTHGRAYLGRYKLLVIFQGVSLVFLIFGVINLLFWNITTFSRVALVFAWILTFVFLTSARLWSKIWRAIIKAEEYLWSLRPPEKEINNVLVIGGAGFIGSALLPKLLDKGYKVRVLDLFIFGLETIESVKDHPNLEIYRADFQSMKSVVYAMQGMDAVVHLGAIVGDPACELNRGLTVELNSMSVRMIAELAKTMKVDRFIFASTCSVYGASDEVLDERSILQPVSLYAESKILSEKILMNLADNLFKPVILRFGTIYGVSGRTRFDLVINLLAAKAIVDGEITIFGGDQWRPFVHVEDAALAITKALEAPFPMGHSPIYNVGSNEQNYTIQQVAEIIHQIVPTAELKSMGSETDQRNYRVNFDKIRKYIGFVPRWTVEKGVNQVIGTIQSGKVQDYRDPKYSNLGYLRKEGLNNFKANPQGYLYDLLNTTISPTPWDGEERRSTPQEEERREQIETQRIKESDVSGMRKNPFQTAHGS